MDKFKKSPRISVCKMYDIFVDRVILFHCFQKKEVNQKYQAGYL